MDNPVIIIGASGLGTAALEIFNSNKVDIYGFLDDNKEMHQTEILGISVLGSTDDDSLLKLIGKKCEVFVASDEKEYRQGIVEMLISDRKVMPVNAIHNKATIASSASIGHGNFLNAGSFVGANAELGNHCILHTNAVIEHESEVEDYVQIGSGSIINSDVKIGKDTFLGSGVTVVSGVTIGSNVRIGAGSVVIADVAGGSTVFGNPAKEISSTGK